MVSNLLRCCFPVTKESIITTISEFKSQDKENEVVESNNMPLNIKAIQIANDIKLNGQSALNENKKSLISLEHQTNTERTSDFNRNLINNLEYKEESLVQHKSSTEIKSSLDKENAVSESVSFNLIYIINQDLSIQTDYRQKIISELEEAKYPILHLNTITGNAINNEELIITAAGLVKSIRKSRDMVTFFGYKPFEKDFNFSLNNMIDYELCISNVNSSQLISSIVFLIYFKKEVEKYYIKTDFKLNKNNSGIPNVLVQIKEPYVSIII